MVHGCCCGCVFKDPLKAISLLTLSQGKRLLIKDMAYYLFPPEAAPASIAPSVGRVKRGVGTTEAVVNGTTNGTPKAPYPYDTDAEPNNPTVIPRDTLGNFHFTFLIRHPRSSIPSYYRCCVPPLDEVTGFYDFMPSEAGYDELRRLFDYLRSIGQVGPEIAEENPNRRSASNGVDLSNGVHSSNAVTNGIHASNGVLSNGDHSSNGVSSNGISANCISSNGISSLNGVHSSNGFTRGVEVCVIDADDLLDNPAGIVEAFCKSTGIDFTPDMLEWSTEADQQQAEEAFSKWVSIWIPCLPCQQTTCAFDTPISTQSGCLPAQGITGQTLIARICSSCKSSIFHRSI